MAKKAVAKTITTKKSKSTEGVDAKSKEKSKQTSKKAAVTPTKKTIVKKAKQETVAPKKAKTIVKKSTDASSSKKVSQPTKKTITTAKKVIAKTIQAPKSIQKEKKSEVDTEKITKRNNLAKDTITQKSPIKEKRKYTKKEDKKENKPIEVVSKKVEVVISDDKPRAVKSILISLPKPETGKSPYIDIANQFKIKLDWRPFTEVQPIKIIDFRLQKIYIEQYKNIIFTSKTSVEQYFRILQESRQKISEENKYFCINEAIALYLQKFINYRKRKVFFGDGKLPKLMEVIIKNRDKNGNSMHLIPSSETKDKALTDTLKKYNIEYKEAVLYRTIPSNLEDLKDVKYDMLVFFNSIAIDSLYSNFPDFVQDKTRLAIYGNSTAETVMKHKLRIDVFAPTPTMPSLADAIKKYITLGNKK